MIRTQEERYEKMEQKANSLKQLNRKVRRNKQIVYWGLVAHLAVAAVAIGSFMHIAAQPTGDEKFQSKYCTLVNARHINSKLEESKVWSCPGVEWR